MLNLVFGQYALYAGGNVIPITMPEVATKSPWYVGVGAVWAKLSGCHLKKCSYEDVTYGAVLRGGYDYNEYLGIEVRAMRTFLDEGPYGGTPLQHIGVFAKPQYRVTEQINLYTLLGYGYTENLGNGGRLTYFDTESGFSAGLGLEYKLSPKVNEEWSIFLDYQRLLIKENVADLDMVTFGVRYDF